MRRQLKSLHFLIYLAAVGVALALVEHHQSSFGHLMDAPEKRKQELYGQSLRDLTSVLVELYPDAAEPNLLMGKALAEQGKLHEARIHLEKSLETDRRSEALLFVYARLLLDLGEDPEEIKAIVGEIRNYYPRSREMVEEYFKKASNGKIRFADEGEAYLPFY